MKIVWFELSRNSNANHLNRKFSGLRWVLCSSFICQKNCTQNNRTKWKSYVSKHRSQNHVWNSHANWVETRENPCENSFRRIKNKIEIQEKWMNEQVYERKNEKKKIENYRNPTSEIHYILCANCFQVFKILHNTLYWWHFKSIWQNIEHFKI